MGSGEDKGKARVEEGGRMVLGEDEKKARVEDGGLGNDMAR
jgi:hypothetical protein